MKLSATILRLHDVTRSFPGVLALDAVAFDLQAGEVHALVGENGAGKSTLINIVSGVLQPDRGEMLLHGSAFKPASPRAARAHGIVVVHQEAELFADLSVAENMALMQGVPLRAGGLVDWPLVYRQASQCVDAVGDEIDVRMPAARLSVAHRHMTQVAAAVLHRAQIVILDEPTSALSEAESDWLFAQLRRLKQQGTAIIYISHRQQEIFALADRITVLRDGQRVWTGPRADIDRDGLIEAMVGRPVAGTRGAAKRLDSDRQPRLSVRELSDVQGRFHDLSLSVAAGEIVGLYGLIGAGRSELAQCLFGLRPVASGTISVDGRTHRIQRPQDAVRAGIAYVPEDRIREALCRDLSVRSNTVLPSLRRWTKGLLVRRTAECEATQKIVDQLAVRLRSVEQPVGELSGGNQQKVVLGRWLLTEPAVLLLDEPTRGVDVGAKAEMHILLRQLADEGSAVLLISSDLPEVMQHADRLLVLRNGEIAGQFDPAQATARELAAAALPRDDESPSSPVSPGWQRKRKPFGGRMASVPRAEWALLGLVVVLTVWLGVTGPGFEIVSVLAGASLWMLLGLAAAIVIIAGGIDISLGSLLALSAASAATVLQLPLPAAITIPLALLVGPAVGVAGGLMNGAIALLGRVHPIVVTLGTMTVYRGLVIALLGGQAITGLPPFLGRLALDPRTGFRGSLMITGVIVLAASVWLNHTRTGRYLYAVGSGPEAARLAGISRFRTWLIAFGVGGGLAGLAGVLELAYSQQMQSRLGVGWELNAIAVAVIGGVAITGGRGSVFGVVLGAILLRLINSALVRWGVTDDQFELFVGVMILTAVLTDLAWRKRLAPNGI